MGFSLGDDSGSDGESVSLGIGVKHSSIDFHGIEVFVCARNRFCISSLGHEGYFLP